MPVVYGTLCFCAGVIVFALALNLVRRPNAPAICKRRLFREFAIFTSMVALLGGLAVISAHLTAKNIAGPGLIELLEAAAIVAGTVVIVWSLWRPVPAEDLPTPADGTEMGPRAAAASGPGRRKVA